jgi:thioredoxin reductase
VQSGNSHERYDAAVVGAGPAGLSAALILGRCRRRVLVCDRGNERNSPSRRTNGFLTRDGVAPSELRRLGREELARYDTVQIRDVEVTSADRVDHAFRLRLADQTQVFARKLLLATGVADDLPTIDGFDRFFGVGVFHCPYCDGWELRNQPLAVLGRGEQGTELALELTCWSSDIVLCTNGPAELSAEDCARLERRGIAIREEAIAAIEGARDKFERIRFVAGEPLPRRALFFKSNFRQACNLAIALGCKLEAPFVKTGSFEQTCVPGLFVAGDAARHVQFAIIAAAQGADAAFAINMELLREDTR